MTIRILAAALLLPAALVVPPTAGTLLAATAAPVAATAPRLRPATWAQPVLSGSLENWHRLDDKVYRSGQPSREGFEDAVALGIREVLNLRDFHSDEDEARGLPLVLHRIPMDAGKLTIDSLVAALRVIGQAKGPVLVHCWHGSDRTGAVSALYRVIFQGWSKEQALDEMVNGGYGFHAMYDEIKVLIRGADVEAMRRRVTAP